MSQEKGSEAWRERRGVGEDEGERRREGERDGEDLPPLPVDIQVGVAGKLSTSAKLALGIAGDVLSVVQFSVSGKARIAFKYISQVLMALTTGSSVSPAPVALKTK